MDADGRFDLEAKALGYNFDGEIKIGGNYLRPVVASLHAAKRSC